MAHTFDIRFARSAGLAAMLEAPANSFRWTGNGRLSIDALGISLALKRGLSSLLIRNRMRRIPAANLKEVFREGESLRVEFATDDSARASLQFWAHDRDTAAQIVSLLPTTRTVELEESAAAGGYRVNRRIAAVLGVALALIAGAILAISLDNPRPIPSATAAGFETASLPAEAAATNVSATQPAAESGARAQPVPDPASFAPAATGDASDSAARAATSDATPPTTPTSDNPPSAAAAGVADIELQPPLPGSQESVISPPPLVPPGPAISDANVTSIPRGTLSWKLALRQLAVFGSESDDLLAAYDDDFSRLRLGQIGRVEFTARLSNLEKRWWDVTYRILEAQDFADPLLVDLRATLLACARERRDFLTSFSQGTATRDQKAITSALAHQARAVELNQRARRYID